MAQKNRSKNKPRMEEFNIFSFNKMWLILLIVLGITFGYKMVVEKFISDHGVTPSAMLKDIKEGNAKEVCVEVGNILATVTYKKAGEELPYHTQIPFFLLGEYFTLDLIEQLGEDFDYKKIPENFWETFNSILLLALLLFGIIFFVRFIRGMQSGAGASGAMSFARSRAKLYSKEENAITFADIAGQAEAKAELEEIVDFLKEPERYHNIGARIPRGVLLMGMPGTGKTLMAKAVAGEAGVNFFHISGSDFVEMFVGVGASRVRDLFEQGRRNSPCIIFIDELDAVGRERGAGYGGGHDEKEQTLNQMLVEMDGFEKSDNVIVLAATNRPDVLDPALLRPGRFDRQVTVQMPDVKEREAILQIHAAKIQTASDVDLNTIAKATPGSSGAQLANLVNEAALYAARNERKKVTMEDFEEARDKILMGLAQHSRIISDDEKWATAYHEAGHAMLHYLLKNIDPLHKVTIVPRGRAAGVTFSLPEQDRRIPNKGQLLDQIKLCMGGYVAEEIFYGETTAGTQNDIMQATQIARKMVKSWGMSGLGFISFGQEDEPIFIGREITHVKEFSEETSAKIDQEVNKIISECLKEVRTLLKAKKSLVQLLASKLVEHETLDDAQIREFLGLPSVDKLSTIAKKSSSVSIKPTSAKTLVAKTATKKSTSTSGTKKKSTSTKNSAKSKADGKTGKDKS